jgi:hypothetical protein
VILSCLLLRGLRSWRGWRLQWDDSPPKVASRQFGIVHLLAWTAAIAFPLGMLQTVFLHRRQSLVLEVLIMFAWSLPVSVPAFCWAIRQGKARRTWAWISITTIALVSAWPVLFFGYFYFTAGRAALPPWWAFPLLMAKNFTTFMVMFLVLAGNTLWMERLGLRIRKPVSPANATPAVGEAQPSSASLVTSTQ